MQLNKYMNLIITKFQIMGMVQIISIPNTNSDLLLTGCRDANSKCCSTTLYVKINMRAGYRRFQSLQFLSSVCLYILEQVIPFFQLQPTDNKIIFDVISVCNFYSSLISAFIFSNVYVPLLLFMHN